MKKIFSFLAILISSSSFGQTPQNLGGTNTNLIVQSLMTFDSDKSTLNLHLYDTATTKLIWPTKLQYRLARESNGRLYQFIGAGFQLFDNVISGGGGSGDSTIFATLYRVDTAKAALRTSIATKLNTSDTATMLTPYARKADYVPYIGAAGNVNIGTYNLLADAMQFNTTPSVTSVQGLTYWDAANGTLATTLDVANGVTLQIGQENHIVVVNKTGVTINDGQVVYISGAQGNRPTAALAQSNAVGTSSVIGVATQSISNNLEGYVTTVGVVNGYNTSSFTAGDELFVSATTAGLLTNVAPTSPNNVVAVAIALNSTVNGAIYVHPQKGVSADTTLSIATNRIAPSIMAVKAALNKKLSFTDTGRTNGQIATAYVQNKIKDSLNVNIALKAPIASPTFTGTVTTPNLTVNALTSGTTNDSLVVSDATSGVFRRISSSRIGGGTVPGSNKQVIFNDGGVLAGAATFYWDKATGRMGIGTSSPAFPITILDNNAYGGIQVRGDLGSGFMLELLGNSVGGIYPIPLDNQKFSGSKLGDITVNSVVGNVITGKSGGSIYQTVGPDNVMIGSTRDATANSLLELSSTSKGFLPPRLTTSQRNAVTWGASDNGTLIICTDCTATDGSTGVLQQYQHSTTTWKNAF